MRLDQLFKEDDTTVKTMSMPEKVAAFDRLKPGQEIGLWFDSVIRRADKYKPFVVGRKTSSKLRPLEKITLLQKSKDGGTGGMKYYLYKRNGDNVSLAMGDMAASLVDIQESNIVEATETIMERIVLDIDYNRNPEALMKAINVMAKRLDLTLMNAPQAIKDLKEKGFARIEGKDADIMSFVNYLYSKGIEPNYDIQNMDKVMTPGLNKNKAMPAFIGKKKVPAEEGFASDAQRKAAFANGYDPKKKKVKEEAPFDGMGLVQRMVFNKWISIDEWNVLKDKFKDAAQEIEDNYDDWPEGEGFGSSDHNFAIKELMEILGYKFDNEDRSGKFVVSDVPDEVKNAGLRNIRQKDPDPIIASEGHSNTRHQAQTMLKLEELRDMIMVLDMDDDSKTSALTALDQVADDITILESEDDFEPHYMYKGDKKEYKAKWSAKEKDHKKLAKQGYDHDDPETKKIEEQAPHTHPITEAEFDEAAGEKDACYHKVKSRYKVWPSAYASGALAKCRKVGAKNWGNKSKK